MANPFAKLAGRLRLDYGRKVFLLASVPLILAVSIIAGLVAHQSRVTAEQEIAFLQNELIAAKKAELKNYLSLARTAFVNIYGRALPDDARAKLEVTRILAAMLYGRDGYFFVYDYDGNNLVSPRRTEMIGKNWLDLRDGSATGGKDGKGRFIVRDLIRKARLGDGYLTYDWPKPSTGKMERMVAYVVGLQDWRWAVGTGIFIDDVMATVAAERAEVEQRVRQTFLYIGAITLAALLLVFTSGMFLNIRERRLADAKLKKLTQRVLDTQEEERARVARELHDSISQMLVGVRYKLELARRRLAGGDARAHGDLDDGIDALSGTIQEVRRISRDLRPGVLDDLGLGPALKSLMDDFSRRTGIRTQLETVVFRNRLDHEAKIALYRVAQEALTNIERHAGATRVDMVLKGHRKGATMRIADNGCGIDAPAAAGPDSRGPGRRQHGVQQGAARAAQGLGLRNMQERIEQLDGTLRILSAGAGRNRGTVIEVLIPLSHMLPPEQQAKASA